MIALLIIYLLFIFVYVAFNVYIIFRINTMRVKGDATGRAILIYVIAIFIVMAISLGLISTVDWNTSANMRFLW